MNSKYLHIDYNPDGLRWIFPIRNCIDKSLNPALRERRNALYKNPLKELGLAIPTKLDMLKHIVHQVDQKILCLEKQLNTDIKEVEGCLKNDAFYRYPITDTFRNDGSLKRERFIYGLLVDIDSFIFESRSIYEIVEDFLRKFAKLILGVRLQKNCIKEILDGQGNDSQWIKKLRDSRIKFFHKNAPWIAVRIDSISPLKGDLVIMEKDVKDFNKSKHYFCFEQLRQIHNGIDSALDTVLKWLLKNIEEY